MLIKALGDYIKAISNQLYQNISDSVNPKHSDNDGMLQGDIDIIDNFDEPIIIEDIKSSDDGDDEVCINR